jgi:hypothetical protein
VLQRVVKTHTVLLRLLHMDMIVQRVVVVQYEY